MKYLVSAIGSKFEFTLDATHHFVFDPIVPVQVTEEQFLVLHKRLGVQLKEVSQSNPVSEPVKPDHIDEELE